MRRLWLLVLIGPSLAVALPPQPTVGSGIITWETIVRSNTDGFINVEECASGSITLSWSANYVTSTSSGGSFATTKSFQLYASNNQPGNTCFTQSDPNNNNLVAGPVGSAISSSLTNPMTATFDTSAIATVAGRACSGSGSSDIFLCIQAMDSGNTAIGFARIDKDGTSPAKLVLARDRPPAPTDVSASSGEQAANVSWSAGTGSISSDSFEVEAWFPAVNGTIVRRSGRITSSPYRLTGLTNDQTYGISVVAFSNAGNPSGDPVVATSVTPGHVLDFFAAYKDAGGQEQGGCAGGPAGPVALLAAAAALLAVRRTKK